MIILKYYHYYSSSFPNLDDQFTCNHIVIMAMIAHGSGVLVGRKIREGFSIVDQCRCVIGRHVHPLRVVALAHFTTIPILILFNASPFLNNFFGLSDFAFSMSDFASNCSPSRLSWSE